MGINLEQYAHTVIETELAVIILLLFIRDIIGKRFDSEDYDNIDNDKNSDITDNKKTRGFKEYRERVEW